MVSRGPAILVSPVVEGADGQHNDDDHGDEDHHHDHVQSVSLVPGRGGGGLRAHFTG